MARPRKEIQPWQVYKLARIGCTNEEIAVILDCHSNTLVNNFCDVLKKGRERMKMSLRRMQYRAACAGDRTILIWLGKQYLGQRDKQDLDVHVTDQRKAVEATIDLWLSKNPEANRDEAIEWLRPQIPDIDRVLASERIQ